jgi:hypothetical protein
MLHLHLSLSRHGWLGSEAYIARTVELGQILAAYAQELDLDQNAQAATLPLTYAAASADQSQASLTVRENYGDAPIPIPASGWAYTDSTLTAVQLLPKGTNFGAPGTYSPTALYEFSYIAKDPLIVGLGFAAILPPFCVTPRRMMRGPPTRSPAMSNTSTRSAARSPAARRAISSIGASTKLIFRKAPITISGAIAIGGITSGYASRRIAKRRSMAC